MLDLCYAAIMSSHLKSTNEQDAHEFLRCLLSTIEVEYLKRFPNHERLVRDISPLLACLNFFLKPKLIENSLYFEVV